METKTCKWCGKIFENINPKVFSNHVRWCEENPNRNNIENIKDGVFRYYDKKLGEMKIFKVKCQTCGKEFEVEERENQFPKKEKYFCSRNCANSRNHSSETKEKIRKNIDSYLTSIGKEKRILLIRKCEECGEEYETLNKSQKFCSKGCASKHHSKKRKKEKRNFLKENFDYYRRECNFNFSIKHYNNEFDITLLENYGMYSPSNKNNNLTGVSRDHIISVRYGFDNNINPKIISHPANCQLLIHNKNISKGKKCDITLRELEERIIIWNKKYGVWDC